MIKLKNIDKYYYKNKDNEIHVLNDINLEFDERGLTTILGPSGSGKSTLLHVIGGLDKASGSLDISGINVNKLSQRQRDLYRNKYIGYIFQNYNLIPELTVYDNLKVQLDLVHVTEEDEIEKRIHECLEVVGMERYKRRKVTALSGGQQQRVAIARALVKGSKVIIADEPTGNLDSKNSLEVMNLLRQLSKQCLIILVTHNITLAEYYSDRIIKIKDGQIIDDIRVDNKNGLLDSDAINSIYLDQFEHSDLNIKNYQVDIYNKAQTPIKLRIVFDGSTMYIENSTDAQIKILGENSDKILVEKTPETPMLSEEPFLDLNYMDYNETSTFKQKLKFGLKYLKNAFIDFIFASKKTWLVYFCFFLIGAILSFCLCSISYSTYIDGEALKDDPVEAVRVFTATQQSSKFGPSFELEDLLTMLEDNGEMALVDKLDSPRLGFSFIGSRQILVTFEGTNYYMTTPEIYHLEESLKGNEIIITSTLADEIIDYLGNFGIKKYSDLIGQKFNATFPRVYTGEVIIKKVIPLENKTFFVSNDIYYTYRAQGSNSSYKLRVLEEGEILDNLEEVQENGGLIHLYVSNHLKGLISSSATLPSGYKMYCIHGYFDSEDPELVFLSNTDYIRYLTSFQLKARNVLPYETANIKLTKGNYPVSNKEIILPDSFSAAESWYKIGEKVSGVSGTYTISGFYDDSENMDLSLAYTNFFTAYTTRVRYYYQTADALKDHVDFYTANRDETIEYFTDAGYEAYYVRTYVMNQNRVMKIDASQIALIISVTIVAIMVVFIFFISRSRMLKNIYNTGVYRALGAKKSKMYKDYFINGLFLATFTAVLGFTLIYLFACYANQYLKGVAFSGGYFALGLLIIYSSIIFASLLPVVLLLRKTPVEILAKYDI